MENLSVLCDSEGRELTDQAVEVRLPWEIEWEYSATQGGERPAKKVNEDGRYEDKDRPRPYPVGLEVANDWGISGLASNVAEWLQDGYVADSQIRRLAQLNGHITDNKGEMRVIGKELAKYDGEKQTTGDPFRGFRIVIIFREGSG